MLQLFIRVVRRRVAVYVCLAFACVGANAHAQTITTVVGGMGGSGPATSAALYFPFGVAVDGVGNLYIADSYNNVIRKVDAAGVIRTAAGNGTKGYSGDGGAATSAALATSQRVAVDTAGNVYIADSNNGRIRKVDSSGKITNLAGNGTAGYSGDGGAAASAELNFPNGLALDTAGNLYIADTLNNVIRKVDTGSTITTVAGNGMDGYSGDGGAATSAKLSSPYGLNVDRAGNLYIADSQNNAIRKVDTSGTITTVAGNGASGYSGDGGAATTAALSFPVGVMVDSTGNLYIADTQNNRIRKVDSGGTITTIAGDGTASYSGDGGPASSSELYYPYDIAVDAAGSLYISVFCYVRKIDTGGTITTIAGNGAETYSGDGSAARNAELAGPSGAAVDAAGNLFIADTGNGVMRKVDSRGKITRVAGRGDAYGDGGTATSAALSNPVGAALDAAGNLYFIDHDNYYDRIRKVDRGGTITTVAGGGSGYLGDGGPATSAYLVSPYAVAVDGSGNLYIADTGNDRIRKVDSSGTITTVAGNGTDGYSGDGFLATSAKLSQPYGLAADEAGDLYIADTFNNRIRKVDTHGMITTVAGNGQYGYSGDGDSATSSALANPHGVGVDVAGNLYIADTLNHVIRKVAITGTITTVAGGGMQGLGDGGVATSSKLSYPSGVTVDGAGNLYISDSGNNRIRKVSLVQIFKDGFEHQN